MKTDPYTTEKRRMDTWDAAHNAPGEPVSVAYYQCRTCAYGTTNADYIVAHVTSHPPVEEEARQTVGVEPTSPGASPDAPVPGLAAPKKKE